MQSGELTTDSRAILSFERVQRCTPVPIYLAAIEESCSGALAEFGAPWLQRFPRLTMYGTSQHHASIEPKVLRSLGEKAHFGSFALQQKHRDNMDTLSQLLEWPAGYSQTRICPHHTNWGKGIPATAGCFDLTGLHFIPVFCDPSCAISVTSYSEPRVAATIMLSSLDAEKQLAAQRAPSVTRQSGPNGCCITSPIFHVLLTSFTWPSTDSLRPSGNRDHLTFLFGWHCAFIAL